MKIATSAAAAGLLMFMAVPALATPSWDYVALQLIAHGEFRVPGDEVDLKGYRWQASKALGANYFVAIGHDAQHFRDSGEKVDLSMQRASLGYHRPLTLGPVTVDIWSSLNLERVTFFGQVGRGYSVDLGAKIRPFSGFETGVAVTPYGDIDFNIGALDLTAAEAYLSWDALRNLAVIASYRTAKLKLDSSTSFRYRDLASLGVKFTF